MSQCLASPMRERLAPALAPHLKLRNAAPDNHAAGVLRLRRGIADPLRLDVRLGPFAMEDVELVAQLPVFDVAPVAADGLADELSVLVLR